MIVFSISPMGKTLISIGLSPLRNSKLASILITLTGG